MRRAIAFSIFILGFSACQRYRPEPLDLARHLQAWRDRDADALAEVLNARGPESFDPDDGLSLAEIEVCFLFGNRELRGLRAAAQIPLAAASGAAAWEDPELNIDGERLLDAETWDLGFSLGFTIPLSGRKGARRDLLKAEHATALRRVQAAEWAGLGILRQAFAAWSTAQSRLRLLQEQAKDFSGLIAIAERLHEGGVLTNAALRALRLEIATLELDTALADSEAQAQRAALIDCMGLPADGDWQLQPSLALAKPGKATLLMHPSIREQEAAYLTSEAALRLEIRRQYPDLHIGLGGGREGDETRLGIGLGLFPLPIWNSNQEGIATARGARLAQAVTAQTALEALHNRVLRAQRRLTAASTAAERMQQHLLPLCEEQFEELERRAGHGDLDVALLLDALRTRSALHLRHLGLLAEQQAAAIELAQCLGPQEDKP